MVLSKYVKIYSCKEDPEYLLFYSTRYNAKVLLPVSVLEEIRQGGLDREDEETLTKLGFLVRDADEEKKDIVSFLKDADDRRDVNAIVVLNLDCNLACTYCFEGTLKGKHYMTQETADKVIHFARQYLLKQKNVNLVFYGGEPLLSFETIKYISQSLKDSAEEKGLTYTFGLITNGTLLTKERVGQLIPYGLTGAKITLDGLKSNHDKYRPYKSGAGSFDRIIENIIEVTDLIRIQVGGNFTRENYADFPLLLDFLVDHGVTPGKVAIVKFDPITKSVQKFALPDFRDGAVSISEPWLIPASIYLREEILKRGFETFTIDPSPCSVEFRNDIIINYDGTLNKCPAFIGIKDMEVGHLDSGIKDYTESHNLDVWKRDTCLDCEYLPLCFGGCRFMKFMRDGSIDDVDCKKEYLDATLEAFIRQDIKYQRKTESN